MCARQQDKVFVGQKANEANLAERVLVSHFAILIFSYFKKVSFFVFGVCSHKPNPAHRNKLVYEPWLLTLSSFVSRIAVVAGG